MWKYQPSKLWVVIYIVTRFTLYIYWGLVFCLDLYYNKVKSIESKKDRKLPDQSLFSIRPKDNDYFKVIFIST